MSGAGAFLRFICSKVPKNIEGEYCINSSNLFAFVNSPKKASLGISSEDVVTVFDEVAYSEDFVGTCMGMEDYTKGLRRPR